VAEVECFPEFHLALVALDDLGLINARCGRAPERCGGSEPKIFRAD
jgi:hypothetical protein